MADIIVYEPSRNRFSLNLPRWITCIHCGQEEISRGRVVHLSITTREPTLWRISMRCRLCESNAFEFYVPLFPGALIQVPAGNRVVLDRLTNEKTLSSED